LLAVALLAVLAIAAPAGGQTPKVVDIPYSEVAESVSSGDGCLYSRYYLQFGEVKGASSYEALNRYHGGGYTLDQHGPPFPDDDEQGDGFHFRAPKGQHRFGATAQSGAGPCPSLVEEWQPDYVHAVFTDAKARIVGSTTEFNGTPVDGVPIAIAGASSEHATTRNGGVYSVRVKKGRHTVRAPKGFCAAGIATCKNEKTVRVDGTETVSFVRRQPPLTVKGTVRDEFRRGLGGVQLKLTGPQGDTATSDGAGRYSLEVGEPGTYELTAVAPNRPRGPYEQYFIVRDGAPTDGKAADVTLAEGQDPVVVDWELDRRLQLELRAPPPVPADGFSRVVASVTARTQHGDPAPGVELRIDPSADAVPRAVACTTGAASHPLWPDILPDGSVAPVGFPVGPDTTTDANGTVSFRLFPGTQAGELRFVGSRRGDTSSVFAGGVSFSAAPTRAVDRDSLRRGLQQVGPNGTTFFQSQAVVLELLAARQGEADLLSGVDAAPVKTGSKQGIVFFSRGSPPRQFSNGEVDPSATGFVLDNTLLQRITGVPALPTLAEWAGGDAITVDRRDPRTFLGWPIPTRSNGGLETCLDAAPAGTVVFAAHSPVQLLLTDSQGRKLGANARGHRFADAPGASFRRGGVSYVIAPAGSYKLTVAGTGKGPVVLESRSAAGTSVARFKARKGAQAKLSVPNGALPGSFKFGGRRVRSSSGMPLVVHGLPRKLRAGKARKVSLRVTDALGKPASFAVLSRGAFVRFADARGRLKTTLPALKKGKAVFTITAADLLPAKATIRVTGKPRRGRG
jgi:hypothetical protein